MAARPVAGRAPRIEINARARATHPCADHVAGNRNSQFAAVGACGRSVEDLGVTGLAERPAGPARLDGPSPAAGAALVDRAGLAAVAVPSAVGTVAAAGPGPAADRADLQASQRSASSPAARFATGRIRPQ